MTTTGTNEGIETTNDGTEAKNTVTVTETGSITTGTGNNAYGIYNDGASTRPPSLAALRQTGNMHTAFITMAQQHDHRLWQHYDRVIATAFTTLAPQHDHRLWQHYDMGIKHTAFITMATTT